MPQRRLVTIGRFEWEKIIRRLVVPQKLRAVKTVALMAATYANSDGTRVYPGERRLAEVCQLSERTVRDALGWLRDNGLIFRHSRGSNLGRQAMADRYQLCSPEDWQQRLDLLPDASDPKEEDDPWVR